MPPRVLVVDDSAVVRQAFSQILTRAGMAVVTANDPLIAMDKMRRERPDAIVLDIEMPRMDGLTFLRKVMSEDAIPVVVCSGLAGAGTDVALHALDEGAVDIVTKPRLGVKGFLEDSAAQLVEVVRGALQARVRRRLRSPSAWPAPGPTLRRSAARPRAPAAAAPSSALAPGHPLPSSSAAPATPAHPAPARARRTAPKLVVVGASTGGTEALRVLLEAMPHDAPAIAIVQHMPEIFTAQFARRLDQTCRVEVREAAARDALVPGRALVARGNHHLVVRRSADGYFVEITDGPPVSLHRPSVDVLFRSAARAAGPDAIGALLTGMGDDGADGLGELKRAGAHTIAQDEATSIVFGMPREAIARGAVAEVLPLPRIAQAILRWSR